VTRYNDIVTSRYGFFCPAFSYQQRRAAGSDIPVFRLVVLVYYLNIISNVWIPEPYFCYFACYGNGSLCCEFNGKRMVAINYIVGKQEEAYNRYFCNLV